MRWTRSLTSIISGHQVLPQWPVGARDSATKRSGSVTAQREDHRNAQAGRPNLPCARVMRHRGVGQADLGRINIIAASSRLGEQQLAGPISAISSASLEPVQA